MTASRIIACLAGSLVAASPVSAEFYGEPMPDRPGCEIIDRVPIYDGYRHGMRIYWRCPRLPEPEEECCESAAPDEPPVYEADTSEPEPASEPEYTYSSPSAPAASPLQWHPRTEHQLTEEPSYTHEPKSSYRGPPDIPAAAGFLAVLAVVALLVFGLIASSENTSSLERDVRETRALTDKLNAAAYEADARIAAFLKKEGLDG